MTQHQLNSKNNGSFLRPYIRHENSFLSSVAKDGNDGHGLNLEKIGEIFLSFTVKPGQAFPSLTN